MELMFSLLFNDILYLNAFIPFESAPWYQQKKKNWRRISEKSCSMLTTIISRFTSDRLVWSGAQNTGEFSTACEERNESSRTRETENRMKPRERSARIDRQGELGK